MAGEAVTQQVGINFLGQALALGPIPDSDLYGACGDGIAELADEYMRFLEAGERTTHLPPFLERRSGITTHRNHPGLVALAAYRDQP